MKPHTEEPGQDGPPGERFEQFAESQTHLHYRMTDDGFEVSGFARRGSDM